MSHGKNDPNSPDFEDFSSFFKLLDFDDEFQ
jgi:hypothetical protein